MFLISAFGRSGTHYTSALMRAIGLDAPHEKVGGDGAVSWKHIAPGTFRYMGKNRSREITDPDFSVVIHQVRDPLKVISSTFTFSESTWNYMETRLGLVPEPESLWEREAYAQVQRERDWARQRFKAIGFLKTLLRPKPQLTIKDKRDFHAVLRRAMRCWLGWDDLIARRAAYRFPIERLPAHWPELLRLIGHPPVPLPAVPKSNRDSRIERSSYRKVSWDDLRAADRELALAVEQLALSYGYAVPARSEPRTALADIETPPTFPRESQNPRAAPYRTLVPLKIFLLSELFSTTLEFLGDLRLLVA